VGRGDETDGEGCREMVADSIFIELPFIMFKFRVRRHVLCTRSCVHFIVALTDEDQMGWISELLSTAKYLVYLATVL
jgi:hypothetical protein